MNIVNDIKYSHNKMAQSWHINFIIFIAYILVYKITYKLIYNKNTYIIYVFIFFR